MQLLLASAGNQRAVCGSHTHLCHSTPNTTELLVGPVERGEQHTRTLLRQSHPIKHNNQPYKQWRAASRAHGPLKKHDGAQISVCVYLRWKETINKYIFLITSYDYVMSLKNWLIHKERMYRVIISRSDGEKTHHYI